MRKFLRGISFYVLIFVIIIFFAQIFSNTGEGKTKLSYTQFISEVESKRIREVYISEGSSVSSIVSGRLSDGREFEATVPTKEFNELAQEYAERGTLNVIYEKPQQTSVWLSFLPTIALFVLIIVFFFIFSQQAQGGGSRVMSFGKSRARLLTDDKKKVTFADVAGADEEKEELGEIVDFLKQPRRFIELGARIKRCFISWSSWHWQDLSC